MTKTESTSSDEPNQKEIERDMQSARNKIWSEVRTELEYYDIVVIEDSEEHLHATAERATSRSTSDIEVRKSKQVQGHRVLGQVNVWKYSDSDGALLELDCGGKHELVYATGSKDLITLVVAHLVATDDEWNVQFDAKGDLPSQ